ncbi:rotatin-like [Anticarsia gemmatalis]|uniref:rotatin-like n=1 Tax=Anticarsia gemmatalis TaxID=129554 RepID=UPI003F766320
MASTEILSIYIKKLSHPLKEIRERSLQLLTAKLRLGWELDDELSGTRELLEALLAWFLTPQPSLQSEALELLLKTIKTKAGTYIVREFGIPTILSNLSKVKHKIAADASEVYEDVLETLRFINTVESDCNVAIPRLTIPDLTSSESDGGSSSGYYNLGPNFPSSKETSVSNDSDINRQKNTNAADSIKILLFPWVDLCQSDKKTLLLVEDALRLLKSTRRCCRFIRDVFLRDFPPEIFLNRPEIIKSLLTISDGNHGRRPEEALFVLLYITRALRARLLQLSSLDFVHEANKISDEHKDIDDGVHLELQEIAGESHPRTPLEEDGLATLRQMPAPVYALDTIHAVLSIMARSVVLVDAVDKTEILDMKELNTCLCLVDSLIGLLLDCINSSFWNTDHVSKVHRDISHKSCMVMRLLGDLLLKYRKSFFDDPDRTHHRLAWLRLVLCADKLLHWAQDSALPPTTLITAMQLAQLDPAIELFYPELSKNIEAVLQNTRTAVNQEYKSKYRELKKLFSSMDEAVQFVKNKKSHNTKTILTRIKQSLPALELFQNENFLYEIADILLKKTKDLDMNESDWSVARSLGLNLMAHNLEWVQTTFYKLLAEMVKSVLVGDDNFQSDNEKCLTLLYDVGILTEICCHGLSSKVKEVEESASDIMLYLLRGRLILSESCWWRLLASLLPVLPLLHVYAAHETQLGKAVCKSLERDIAECMGVSIAEVTFGLVRLLYVRCVAVQLDAAHTLCKWLDDDRFLPPKESLRADILLSALRRVKPQEFNVDYSSSPSKLVQTGGLVQILDVLKQDIILDEQGEFVARRTMQPTLEPSLRRSTLQQLAVMMRQQDLHNTFIQCDGVRVIVATLRMSLMVDDYLAFPECAISCVSVLNSICFVSRHELSKIPDLPSLLIRVILVFPANDMSVLMTSQILALVSWAGFALQELDSSRHRIPALPQCIAQRTTLPFSVHSYWNTSPNAEHSYVEWLLAEEEWRAAIRVRWWCAHSGNTKLLTAAPPAAPLALRPTPRDLAALRAACPLFSCTKALLALQNATTHRQVIDALHVLESYVYLVPLSNISKKEFSSLPWQHSKRFLNSPPASSRDTILLCSLLQFVIAYMDNVPHCDGTMSWIKSSFIGSDVNIISLLSRDELYPQQTIQETIEVTQLHIHIVKVLLRCVVIFERGDYGSQRLESLLKILLACLDRIGLKNFHMLGYLNELMRCIRYVLNSRYCKLSEDTLIECVRLVTRTLSGCASGGGCKGQACRLDAILSLLALLRMIHEEAIPVQRWSELFNSDAVSGVVKSASGARADLRAAALHVIAALAYYAQMQPHLLQAIQESSLSEFATQVFSNRREANAVRAAAAALLTAIASRASARSDVLEADVLEQLNDNHFVENCLEILIDFCNAKEYKPSFQPNVSVSLLERRSELEVRAQKGGDVHVSASHGLVGRPPPTASFVTSLADALHNISAFTNCPVQQWNERGLYRLLFRCSSWCCEELHDTYQVRAASCRALLAVTSHKCVRVSLASTKDCLHNLLKTLTAFHEDDVERDCLESRAQGLSLLASLLGERAAIDSVWQLLRDIPATDFFHLLLQCLESDEDELQDAALYCLTQLAQSMTLKKHVDKSKDETCSEFYDNLKSPFWDGVQSQRVGAGDNAGSPDCQPEYMAEEICKSLLNLYQKLSMENKKHQSGEDERWVRVCSCLAAVCAVSARSRRYSVHRRAGPALLASLQAARDHLAVHGKPADAIRNANNNPVLRTLYWVLTVIDCLMVECPAAKESFADENIAISLSRLWPWCMMTEQLRQTVVHLLYTFSNNCPKAWGALCSCVCGRTLLGELCALVAREAALPARPRPPPVLLMALHTLRRAAPHHHCRAIILKSDALVSMHRLCIRARVRGVGASGVAWARLCESVARHAEGAAALLAMKAGTAFPVALPAPTRALLLPAIAHAAHHHRQTFLQSPDLLELLCDTLLAGDTAEIVSAARAIWALAANNHKAKLALRSAGAAAAVHSTLQRLQRTSRDADTQRALQLLMYTNTVLQTP